MRGTLSPVRELIDEYIATMMRCLFPPSPTGYMLEAAMLGLIGKEDDTGLWRRSMGAERAQRRRAAISVVMAGLNQEQLTAVVLMRIPIPKNEHDENQSENYTKIVKMLTRRDEELVGPAEAPAWDNEMQKKHASDPTQYDDHVVVSGTRPVYPTRDQVARKMGLVRADGTPDGGRLSRIIGAAYSIIEDRMLSKSAVEEVAMQ